MAYSRRECCELGPRKSPKWINCSKKQCTFIRLKMVKKNAFSCYPTMEVHKWTKSLPRQLTVALHTQWRIVLKDGKTTTVGRRGSDVGHLLVCEETGLEKPGEEEKKKERTRKRRKKSSEKTRAGRFRKRRGESQSFLLGDADQESEARMSKNALRTGRRQAVE
ncbi:hypothetical protein TNCV_548661 [Trichonephila clavipes]|nr:hypothetical protein TNCV_548661 [Trichonephila clavipes]